jgi:GST-like protein
MIVFYRIPNDSPNMIKISIMLNEIALPYVEKIVDADEDGEAFAEISPNGITPAIVDTDTGATIFESGAILLYLAEKSGKLLPSDDRLRADVTKWLMFEAANVCPTMIELHHYLLNDYGQFSESVCERYKKQLEKYCAILNKQLEDRDYLAGEYSIADIILYPWTVTLEDMADIDIADYPHLNKWAMKITKHLETKQLAQTSSEKKDWCYQNGEVKFCSA